MKGILLELLILVTELMDNNELVVKDEVEQYINNKKILEFISEKYKDKYDINFAEFRINELDDILYEIYCDYHCIKKLPEYKNGLTFLMGIIIKAIEYNT